MIDPSQPLVIRCRGCGGTQFYHNMPNGEIETIHNCTPKGVWAEFMKMEAELAELRKQAAEDTRRLDWLENNLTELDCYRFSDGLDVKKEATQIEWRPSGTSLYLEDKNIREAIDAAMGTGEKL